VQENERRAFAADHRVYFDITYPHHAVPEAFQPRIHHVSFRMFHHRLPPVMLLALSQI
jgi:hypothetical protein